MGVRKAGRCRLIVDGRAFVWWLPNEASSIRIASEDKRFVVEYPLYLVDGAKPLLRVSGQEFPGVDRAEHRPIYLAPPGFDRWYSYKGLARRIIEWSFSASHDLVRAEPPEHDRS